MRSNAINKQTEKIIKFLTIVLYASFNIFSSSSKGSIVFFATTILIFLVDAYQEKGRIRFKVKSYHFFVLIFGVYCIATTLWAWRKSYALEKGITILEIFVCMSILYMHYDKQDDISGLITSVMWADYVIVIYSIIYYGFSTIILLSRLGDRIENSYANVNAIGLSAAIGIVLTLYKVLFIDKRLTWSNVFVLPAVLITGLSGSRKALLIAGIGIFIIFAIRFASNNIFTTVFKWLVVGGIIIVILRLLLTLSIFETVLARMRGLLAFFTRSGTVDHSTWIRQQYRIIGLQQFLKTPVLGIGMNNARVLVWERFAVDTYLHCNYVELLCDGGITGTLLYYSFHIYIITRFFKYKHGYDKYAIICLVLLILYLILDYGDVSYYSKSRYFIFVAFAIEADKIKEWSKQNHYEHINS